MWGSWRGKGFPDCLEKVKVAEKKTAPKSTKCTTAECFQDISESGYPISNEEVMINDPFKSFIKFSTQKWL